MATMTRVPRKVVVTQSLDKGVLKEWHDVPSMDHVGTRETFELVETQFYCRRLQGDTIQYIRIYTIYQVMKSDKKAHCGLLRALEITSRKLAPVTNDLIIFLPDSCRSMAVLVFIWMI